MLLHASHACASLGSSGRPKPGAEPHFELVHIPKNAGTQLEEAGLAAGFRWGAYKWEGLCDGGWCGDKNLGCSMWHVPRGYLRAHPDDAWAQGQHTPFEVKGPDPYKNATTICVVRHPFTRAISQYIYWSALNAGGCANASKLEDCSSFDDTCKPELLNRYINERFNGTNGRFRGALRAIHSRAGPIAPELRGSEGEDCHWLPQWMYVGRGEAEHISCSHVLRVERLEADLLVTAAQYPNHRNFSKVLAPPSPSRCPSTFT